MENVQLFVISLVTVIAIIVTISIFIVYGAVTYFYVGGVISLILGFLDTWLISKMQSTEATADAAMHAKIRRNPARKRKNRKQRSKKR